MHFLDTNKNNYPEWAVTSSVNSLTNKKSEYETQSVQLLTIEIKFYTHSATDILYKTKCVKILELNSILFLIGVRFLYFNIEHNKGFSDLKKCINTWITKYCHP